MHNKMLVAASRLELPLRCAPRQLQSTVLNDRFAFLQDFILIQFKRLLLAVSRLMSEWVYMKAATSWLQIPATLRLRAHSKSGLSNSRGMRPRSALKIPKPASENAA